MTRKTGYNLLSWAVWIGAIVGAIEWYDWKLALIMILLLSSHELDKHVNHG